MGGQGESNIKLKLQYNWKTGTQRKDSWQSYVHSREAAKVSAYAWKKIKI